MGQKVFPTVFHFTHWKAGSQWVRSVFEDACPGRLVETLPKNAHVLERPLQQGAIYSPVYMKRQVFETCEASRSAPQVRVVVIRDLRDALVSWYYSMKVSHQDIPGTRIAQIREELRAKSMEDGLLYLIAGDREFAGLQGHSSIQLSWLGACDLMVRYEELLEDEMGQFDRLLRCCGIEVETERLKQIVSDRSFQSVSGRQRGEEDVSAHHRKGVRGDWRNHFTPRVERAFKEKFADVLVKTGYERDGAW